MSRPAEAGADAGEMHTRSIAAVRSWADERATPIDEIEPGPTPGSWTLTVPIAGGYSLYFGPTCPFRVKHIVGLGDGETITVHLVERR